MLNSIRINHARIKFRDHVVTVMYERVKNSFEGILMYDLTGGFIHEFFNYADSTMIDHTLKYATDRIY